MGNLDYVFTKPSNRGVIVRRATPAEMAAKDKHIDILRSERAMELTDHNAQLERAIERRRAAAESMAESRERGQAKMAIMAALKRRVGRKPRARKSGT